MIFLKVLFILRASKCSLEIIQLSLPTLELMSCLSMHKYLLQRTRLNSIYLSGLSLSIHLINFVSIHFWTLVVSEHSNIDLTRKMQIATWERDREKLEREVNQRCAHS